MAYFQWTEAMSVGVPALDADHRSLIRIINLLHDIRKGEESRKSVETVLDTLRLYGRFHFRREESVIRAIKFPGAAFHRAEHQGFARHIEVLRKRYAGHTDPKLARQLSEYMIGWLRHHILIQDMAYKPYIGNGLRAEQLARGAAPTLPNFVGLSAEL